MPAAKLNSLDLQIEGMACSGCVERVENAVKAIPGVASVSVDLQTKRAKVTLSGAPDLDAITAAIRKAGYEPTIV